MRPTLMTTLNARNRTAFALLILIALVTSACAVDGTAPAVGPATTTTTTIGDLATGAVLNPDGDWILESGTLDGDPFPQVNDWRITMLLADGTIGGTAACNGYGGTFTFDGETLTVFDLFATEMACEPNVMDSEKAFLQTMAQPLTLSRQGDRLTATGDGVELSFSTIATASTAEVVGPIWQLQTLLDIESAVQALGEATLQLRADGTFTASTGCREVSGTYQIASDELRFPQMSAEGECASELADQDSFVISVLEGSRIEVDGNQLSLLSPGGEGLQYRLAG